MLHCFVSATRLVDCSLLKQRVRLDVILRYTAPGTLTIVKCYYLPQVYYCKRRPGALLPLQESIPWTIMLFCPVEDVEASRDSDAFANRFTCKSGTCPAEQKTIPIEPQGIKKKKDKSLLVSDRSKEICDGFMLILIDSAGISSHECPSSRFCEAMRRVRFFKAHPFCLALRSTRKRPLGSMCTGLFSRRGAICASSPLAATDDV